MPESMSISVNGQSQIPPGFRFHPTEEELLHYYLRKKVLHEKIDLDVISEVDLNKLEPWDIQERCRIGTTPQNDWYFFSHKDKKYPTGSRTNRATTAGFWKATGRDKVIYSNCRRIGMRKTLVFYVGRAPNGQKSEWIMHEFRLDDSPSESNEDGWVVCRIFKKKYHFKTTDNRIGSSMAIDSRKQYISNSSNNEGSLEQILKYMGGESGQVHERLLKLPSLESPNTTINQNSFELMNADMLTQNISSPMINQASGISNWEELDQIVASHINVQIDNSRQFACFSEPTTNMAHNCNSCNDQDFQLPHIPLRSQSSSLISRTYHASLDEVDLWNFAKSSSLSPPDAICQVSSAPV